MFLRFFPTDFTEISKSLYYQTLDTFFLHRRPPFSAIIQIILISLNSLVMQ